MGVLRLGSAKGMNVYMDTIRLFFSKTGRAKYISHLDLMRAMSRALKRSELPVWYTEGFNPHIYLTFALPLSLGIEGKRESMDFRLTRPLPPQEVVDRLNANLPEGLAALDAAPPKLKPEAISWADYRIILKWDAAGAGKTRLFREFLARDSIVVLKKTKKGEKELELAGLVKPLSIDEREDGVSAEIRLASGISVNVNPGLLLERFYQESGAPDVAYLCRTAVLTEDFSPFE